MSTNLSGTQTVVVDTVPALETLLNETKNLPNDPPSFFIDIEGVKLGRHGTISIISMYVTPTKTIYLVDVRALGKSAFSTTNSSLKGFFESSNIRKVFFDIRNDSDALFSLYQVSVDGIEDLQLMELATRKGRKDFVADLAKCINVDCAMPTAAKAEWQRTKEHATGMFDPKRGGSYEVFNERPVKPEIVQYCAQDVVLLPKLYEVYSAKMRPASEAFWREEVQKATKERIKASQSPKHDGHSQEKARGPWSDYYIEEAQDAWNEEVMFQAMHGDGEEDEFGDFDEDYDDDYDDDYGSARDCIGYEDDMVKNGEW